MSLPHVRRMLLLVVSLLLVLGTIAVWSSSAFVAQATYGDSLHFVRRHFVGIACGLVLGVGCLLVPEAALRPMSRWLFVVSLVLLLLVCVFGEEIGGARRWFRIGRLSFQPSELAQLSLVLYLADILARRAAALEDFLRGVLPPLLATGLMAGMVVLQPDLGTAVAMGAVALLLLFIAKARLRHLLLLLPVALVALVALIAGAEYRLRRVLAFLDPWQDPQGSGYQILQSYVALGSGGIAGLGVGASLQKLFYLPSAHTDFIFAIIGEELGLVGTTAVLLLFVLFLACGFRLAILTESLFHKYLVFGLVGLIGLEAVVNIAVVTGLIPTKGMPLPFVSYGGTSMVMNLVAFGLVLRGSRAGDPALQGTLREPDLLNRSIPVAR